MPDNEKSGRFNLRIPKSLHAKLCEEAAREGVSLNQLCLMKLSRDSEVPKKRRSLLDK